MEENSWYRTTYTYDGTGRLTQEVESSGLTLSYSYDSAGNRSSMAATGTENYNKTYAYDGNNCIGYVVKHNGITSESVSYTHDANGNMLSETVSGGGYTNYTYNNFNQLTGTVNSSANLSYSYNPQGIRTGKQVNLTAISYLLDGGNVVAEQYGNTVDSTYLRGANLISRTRSNSKDYYLYNAHGDVVNLTNAEGISTKTYAYDAFGNEKVKDIYDSNPFRYCGEYYDTETGTYYLRARYYDPTLGRFTQADTWAGEYTDPLSLNKYSYCYNNPIFYQDYSGNIAISAIIAVASKILDYGITGYDAVSSAITILNPASNDVDKLFAAIDLSATWIAEGIEPDEWSPISTPTDDVARKTLINTAKKQFKEHGTAGIRRYLKNQGELGESLIKQMDDILKELIPDTKKMARRLI